MTKISTLSQALSQVNQLKSMQVELARLQLQLTTQKKGQSFSDLGMDGLGSMRARADFRTLDTYINNIVHADRRINMMTSALGTVSKTSRDLLGTMQLQPQEGEVELGLIGNMASNVFDFVVDLLNEQDGDRYLFAGSATQTQPISDNGTLDSYVQAQLTDWVNGVITTDQLIDSYRDPGVLTDQIVGYSPQLSSGSAGNVYARVDDRRELDYTVKANNDGLRDILVVTSIMKNLPNVIDKVASEESDPAGTVTAPGASRDEQNENFYKLFNDLGAMLHQAISKTDTEHSKLAMTQVQMKQVQDNHKSAQNVLTGIISDIEDVDLNEVAVKLNMLQIQLEASYMVTASISNLSLVNYL